MALQERELGRQGARVIHSIIPDGRRAWLLALPRITNLGCQNQRTGELSHMRVTKRFCHGHMASMAILPRIAFQELARQRAIQVARSIVPRPWIAVVGGVTTCTIERPGKPRHDLDLDVSFKQPDDEIWRNGIADVVVKGRQNERTIATFEFTLQMRNEESLARKWVIAQSTRSRQERIEPATKLGRRQLAKLLPHGPSYRLLDEAYVLNDRAIGFIQYRPAFDDGQGLLNPFLLEEAGAHAGIALLNGMTTDRNTIPIFMGKCETTIINSAPAGMEIEVEARLEHFDGKHGRIWTEARVDGIRILESSPDFALAPRSVLERMTRS